MKPILIETQYLPSLEFFCAVRAADEIRIETCEHFVKQSYRNHTFINTANGKIKLTVPLSEKGNRITIKDIKIDGSGNWKNHQWRTIESAYRNSPFYEHYADELHRTFFTPHIYLVDLNLSLLSLCLNWLGWQKKLSSTEIYQASPTECTDIRNMLLSKKSYSTRNFCRPSPYTQVFGNNFVDNLSLIDLIFCKGPESTHVLRASLASSM